LRERLHRARQNQIEEVLSMKKLMFGVAILFAAACGGKAKSGGEALAKTEEFSKRMCECKDKACGDKVNEDYMKWGQEMAKSAGGKTEDKPDPELTKKLTEAATKYGDCYTKLATATPPVEDKKEPAPAVEDKKEPAPATDDKKPAEDKKEPAAETK
jgi:hypothetical protein